MIEWREDAREVAKIVAISTLCTLFVGVVELGLDAIRQRMRAKRRAEKKREKDGDK